MNSSSHGCTVSSSRFVELNSLQASLECATSHIVGTGRLRLLFLSIRGSRSAREQSTEPAKSKTAADTCGHLLFSDLLYVCIATSASDAPFNESAVTASANVRDFVLAEAC